jgi:hypothetical protein
MERQVADHTNNVGMAQKDETTVAVVISEGAEGFGTQRNLRV